MGGWSNNRTPESVREIGPLSANAPFLAVAPIPQPLRFNPSCSDPHDRALSS